MKKNNNIMNLNLLDKEILEIAEKFKNFKIFLVGGSIRDILSSRRPEDFDLATDATPDEIIKIFKNGIIPTGIKYGTVTLIYKNKKYEITTFRKEEGYSDHRRPDNVKYAEKIEEDLARRDFTINAMAFDLKEQKLVDIFDGLTDLKRKIIRTVGDPDKRFREDGLRLLRAIRFATTLNFSIEEKTFKSIIKNIDMIKYTSWERIRDEFIKILESDKPSIGIELLRKTELLRLIIPELLLGYGVTQNKFHKYDIYYHNIYTCDYAPKNNLIVRLAALFHDIGKPYTKKNKNGKIVFYGHEDYSIIITEKILKRLKFSNEIIEKVLNLIKNHMFNYTEEWTDGAVRRFIRKVGQENINDLLTLKEADLSEHKEYSLNLNVISFRKRIENILSPIEIKEKIFSLKDLKVNGYDVMEIKKISPSPIVGKILNYLFEIVLDDPNKNEREILLKLIEEYKI